MVSLQSLKKQFEQLGYRTNLPVTDAGDGARHEGPLILLLENDYIDRDRMIFVEILPKDDDDPIELIQFRHVYGAQPKNEDVFPELIRAIFLLNRVLPIGHNSLCDETPGLYFAYTLTVPADAKVPDEVVGDVVDLIDYLTTWHGTLFDQLAKAEITYTDVLEDLRERGAEPGPLFFSDPTVSRTGSSLNVP